MKLEVSKPGDRLEQEADRMAGKVMRMAAPPVASPAGTERLQRQATDEKIRKAPAPEEKIQKKDEEKLQRKSGGGAPAASSSVQSAIKGSTGGQPLSSDVRGFMEPRFNADFSNVRVHDDQQSASLSNQLSARAFTYQNHIFFSHGQFQPGSGEGKQLLAHELTHTIQQGHAVQRSPDVTTTATPPQVQRSAAGEILDWIADKARYIPGFTMFTVILGMNPINMSTVDRSASNILRALVEFMPGGPLVTQALENHGIIGKVATWVEGQIRTLGMVGGMFKEALTRFIDSLGVSDLAPWNWGSVWNRAQSIFTTPISRLISFARGLIRDILRFIREAILKPLAALAQGTRGYDLLRALLGEDPVTGEAVPRTAETLIGGFMKLIGQEEIWENIKKGNAIARAWAWFQGALSGLLGFARSIPRRIIETIASLTITDILTVAGAFTKIVGAFAGIAGEFLGWALNQVISLIEILFSVVAPGVMPYIKKAQATFVTILKDPIGFVGNLVRAGKLGFQRFAGKIGEHLKTALIKWLVGPLAEAGVYIPKAFSLPEIVKLVLSVFGLTWQNIRGKLVTVIPEPVLAGLEKTAGILVTLVKDGPAAAWEQIKSELSELKDQLISQITQMVSVEVVKAAVMKLVSMINPAGAVVQAIIAIYNTVSFFIDKMRQISAVVASFIDSIAAIASGQVDAAAAKVEQTLANTLTLVISFLAKFAGLGGIPNKIVGIIKKIRQPIDRGLDKIVAWLGKMLAKAVGGAKNLAAGVLNWWKQKKGFTDTSGQSHNLYFQGEASNAQLMVASTVMVVKDAIRIAAAKATTSEEKNAVSRATELKNTAESIIARLQSTAPGAYKPEDIDKINSVLNDLSNAMRVLLPLISGPVATSISSLQVTVGDLISYNGRHWIVSSFGKVSNADFVKIKRLVPAIKSSNEDGYTASTFDRDMKAGKIVKISEKLTRRSLFVGSTPSKTSDVGQKVKARMQRLGKIDPAKNRFLNARNNTWYPTGQADMGHIVDASVWWNSNGRFKGPKSPEVLTFMKDADNYELEESGQNQSRGASSPNYLPPATT
jgi:hypothetical protein